jgi:hypothetical protein
MATRMVFTDDFGNELNCYIDSNKICFSISNQDVLNEFEISLDLETTYNLVEYITKLYIIIKDNKNNINE